MEERQPQRLAAAWQDAGAGAVHGDAARRLETAERALEYMALRPGTPMREIPVDRVFIGSCTNGRIEDLRAAARIAQGHKVASSVQAMVVPGSTPVKKQAEAEGLDRIFVEAGFDWREAGCSMSRSRLCFGLIEPTPLTLSRG